ncbi:adenosylcobalamin-dependent ribonucleoside-diphosphate reductase [Halorussus ruber]|uniref:adenosylcobalamin-dependent ribonucleoside-diphosphate reductase n=1 Tax=Halorussus ruber TaxID=1126238 RepID=UPI0010928824|nr:adenosylcobalamin-dependent ribonucleoside-diphosphate reductase [Halorussus ruber]
MASLDTVAETVLKKRYLRRDETGEVVETPDEMFRRVASNVARAETEFGGDAAEVEDEFYEALSNLDFLPNSPTLMNAGTELEQLAACFVLPVDDSLESIFTAVKQTTLVHQSGGGTGFSFSRLRPEGDVVQKTGGVASGPVSFMRIFDTATEQIKQGGRRRGANMGVLRVDHPDIETFVDVKREADALRNFNLSVATTGAFWDAYETGESYDLVNPRTDETVGQADPDKLLSAVAEAAWDTGDPGVLFLDAINEHNPTPELGRIEATNPCGEVPLLPYEACILGSVDLGNHTDGGEVDWEKLRETVHLGVRFLDNAIEMSAFPIPEIEAAVAKTRKLGLGVMGFHDMLADLEIPYASDEAVEFAEELMAFVHGESWDASKQLAEERGPFPAWENSTREEPMRNATTTTIAPTGTISLIAGCSASVEPIYGVAYTKQVMDGLEIVNDRFVEIANERGFYSEDLLDQLHGRTTIRDVDAIPDDVKRLFQTAHDVPADRHLEIQAAFQRHVDNAVSKTVNLPHSATVEDVRDIFLRARELDLKGITVFRSGAKPEQVLGDDPLKEECIGECEYVTESE